MKQIRVKYADDLANYGFKLEAPINEVSPNAKLFYIRHGMSQYNYQA